MDASLRRRIPPGRLERQRAGWHALRAGRVTHADLLLGEGPGPPLRLLEVGASQAPALRRLKAAVGEAPLWVSAGSDSPRPDCDCPSPVHCGCELETGWWLLEEWIAGGASAGGVARCLEIEGWLSDAGWAAIAELPGLHEVRLRGVSHCAQSLAALGRLTSLRRARINASEWAGVRAGLAAISRLPRLESLELNAYLDRRSLGVYEGLARSPSLRELRVSTGPWTDDACLEALAGLETLGRLRMGYAPLLRGHGLERFVERRSAIRSVTLGGMAVARVLLFASDLERLEELALDGCPSLTNVSLAYLGGARRLRRLRLTQARRLNDGAIPWLGCLPALRDLTVGGAQLTAHGLEALRTLPLERLELDGGALGDDALAALRGWKSLTELWLAVAGVTDRGLRALESLPNARRIYLRCQRSSLTEFAVERLRRALPGATIHVDPAPRPSVG